MGFWKPSCLRPANDYCLPRGVKEVDDLDEDRQQFILADDVKYGTTTVELVRREPENGLGIIVVGGADSNELPRIEQIRQGSLADRSDALERGDYLLAVNGVQTTRLSHEEIINLLKQAGPHLRLEIKFPLPSTPALSRRCIQKETSIFVKKENDSFGLTIRGNQRPGENARSPYVVTRVRPGSPADRDGLFRVGDRILAVEGTSLEGMSHAQMMNLLRKAPSYARLAVQYDVQVFDAVVNASGPLSVEIDRAGARMGTDKPLGIKITTYHNGTSRVLLIDSIVPASIADRCGALNPGDRIDSINGTDCFGMTVQEAIQLLESDSSTVNMQITPVAVLKADQNAQLASAAAAVVTNRNGNSTAAVGADQHNFRTLPRNHSPPPLPRPPPAVLYPHAFRDPPPPLPPPDGQLAAYPESHRDQLPVTRFIETATRHSRDTSSTPTRSLRETAQSPSRPPLNNSKPGNAYLQYNRINGTLNSQQPLAVPISRHPEPLLPTYNPYVRREPDEASDDGSLYEKTSAHEDTDGLSFLVVIDKKPHESWGVSFAYRRQDGYSEIVVHNLEQGGKAQRTEALRIGDIISQINGKNMRNATLQDAHLQLACDYVTLKVLRRADPVVRQEARHSPAESANSSASVDSAVESWEGNLRPQVPAARNVVTTNGNYNTLRQKGLPHSVSAHHVAEVDSISVRMRGSESIPERLVDHEIKPSYRYADNLKDSVEMMDKILTLNDSWSERQSTPNKSAPTGIMNNHVSSASSMKTSRHDKSQVLDSLLQELDDMKPKRSHPSTTGNTPLVQPAPVIRRVKFQTPNGHISAPAAAIPSGKPGTFEVVLSKDPYYDDFGFSLSDGTFERGVFVKMIRPSGPAELSGLQSFDQILTVNNTDVSHLDCCLAVPLIASAGDGIRLLISRRSLNRRFIKGDENDPDDRSRNPEVDVLESDML